jgi:hypothetical protein
MNCFFVLVFVVLTVLVMFGKIEWLEGLRKLALIAVQAVDTKIQQRSIERVCRFDAVEGCWVVK